MMNTLTILYTQNLNGDLDKLPRLARAITQHRRAAEGRVLLLDMGNACAFAAEECTLTDGRAAPIVLDAMGYDAANVRGYLSRASREKLRENYLNIALADEDQPIVLDGVALADVPPDALPHWLHIALDTAPTTHISPNPTLNNIHTLTLATVTAGQIGVTAIAGTGNTVRLVHTDIITPPTQTRPDATIAGAVEFVRDEVRFLKRKRSR
jgi:hypothetical protein